MRSRTGLCVVSISLWLAPSGKLDAEERGTPLAVRSLGVPVCVPPEDNPLTAEKVDLGRELFFDKRLSRDNTISCATCHDPTAGFADPHPLSIGPKGRAGERNSMTVLNVAYLENLMWDGRASSLEQQVLMPFDSPAEFDLPVEKAVLKLRRQGYSPAFQKVFGEDVTAKNLALAIAAYERYLIAGDSPFDRYLFRNDTQAISDSARRGFDVFLEAKCDTCHLVMTPGLHPFALKNAIFTDHKFHNLGIGMDQKQPDPGRFALTGDAADWGRFRTPTLRNVALTAPYFHDGSAATLADVVDVYDKGGKPNRNLDPTLQPLKLTEQQKHDLVSFLESLTSSRAKELAVEESRTRSHATEP